MIDIVNKKQIIFFPDTEDNPDSPCPHPQETLPFTFEPFDIQFLEGNNALRFDGGDEGLDFEPDSFLVFFIKPLQKLDCSTMEFDPHPITQSVMSVKSSS